VIQPSSCQLHCRDKQRHKERQQQDYDIGNATSDSKFKQKKKHERMEQPSTTHNAAPLAESAGSLGGSRAATTLSLIPNLHSGMPERKHFMRMEPVTNELNT
jgi:hypothetical protein